MNPLQIDTETGFLESPSIRHFTFTAEKKQRFLEIAHEHRKAGHYPNLGEIADQVGVNIRTIDRHLMLDEQFKSEWDEIVLRTEAKCMSDMYDLRLKQPLFMFGLLRRLLPNRWNPDSRMNIQVDFKSSDGLINRAEAIDVEVSPAAAPNNACLPSEKHILTQDTPPPEKSNA